MVMVIVLLGLANVVLVISFLTVLYHYKTYKEYHKNALSKIGEISSRELLYKQLLKKHNINIHNIQNKDIPNTSDYVKDNVSQIKEQSIKKETDRLQQHKDNYISNITHSVAMYNSDLSPTSSSNSDSSSSSSGGGCD